MTASPTSMTSVRGGGVEVADGRDSAVLHIYGRRPDAIGRDHAASPHHALMARCPPRIGAAGCPRRSRDRSRRSGGRRSGGSPARAAATASSIDRPAASASSTDRRRMTVGPTLPIAMRGRSARTPAITTLEMACAARVPTLRNHCLPSIGRDLDGDDQLVGLADRRAIAGVELARRAPGAPRACSGARPRRPPAASTGSESPAGEPFAMLPPMVPRFWICTPPISQRRRAEHRQRGRAPHANARCRRRSRGRRSTGRRLAPRSGAARPDPRGSGIAGRGACRR